MSKARTWAGTGLLAVLVAAAAVWGGGVAGAAATQEEVALTVKVVDQSGNPLDDVRLSATWDGGFENGTTSSNGKEILDVPEGADVTIRTERSFYIRNRPYVVENATDQEVTIEMAQRGQARVVVRDENGPVSNAIVRMFQDGQPVVNTRTGDDGSLTTKQIEQDEYTLITFKEGYLRNKTTVEVDGEIRVERRIEQGSVLATFRVTDDHFDPPRALNNANVTIGSIAGVTTQSNGRVTVSVPVNDRYEVDITKPGYRTVSRELDVDESGVSMNVSIRRTPALNLTTDNDRVVVGEPVRVTVTDEYGDPVSNAPVSLDGSTAGETDADGIVRVPVESAGNHTLSASKDGLEASVVIEGVEPAPDETPTPTATPTATPTTEPSDGIGPGFGLAAAVLALLAVALLARRLR